MKKRNLPGIFTRHALHRSQEKRIEDAGSLREFCIYRPAETSTVAAAQRPGQDSPISAYNELSESQEISEGGRCEDAIQPTVQSMSQGKQARSDNSLPPRLVHEIHPHPHRRHFRHHLFDHFSGELNPDDSATATISAVHPDCTVDKGDTANTDQSPVTGVHERAKPQLLETKLAEGVSFNIDDHRAVDTKQIQQIDIEESSQWPFFGTESRVLPSGRRVSFLKQACWGFSHSNSYKEKVNDQEAIACQKTMKESKTLSRRSNLRRAAKTLDLRKSSPDGAQVVDIDKFKNESLEGPGGEIRQRTDTREILPCATIIDSSSTKGRHPIPKVPSIMRSVTGNKIISNRSTASRERAQPRKLGDIRRSPVSIATAHSPSRQKSLTRSTSDNTKGKSAQSPQRKTVVSSNIVAVRKEDLSTKPKRDDKIVKRCPNNPRKSASVKSKHTSNTKEKQHMNDFSPDSLEDKSSLVIIRGENETSTFEELSVEESEYSDRNLLVDYGDPSRFYFRNEWESRMHTFCEEAASIRRTIEENVGSEVNVEALALIDNIEHMKEEMCELYDYFDQFEREEDTLLRQVQRQLNQANKYCRILHYRLQNAEKHKVDKNRIQELEEELKLSRQVAVSLHWELQTVDSKQLKLEKENLELRHRVVAVETAKEALSQQATKLQYHIDQMSLHAPSPCIISESSEVCLTSDSTSEIKRQMQFMDEKEAMLIRRLVDMQKDRDGLKDELDKYQDLYGELPSAPAPGGNQHTDLKLRLKLAEDQSGVLARKLIEVQLENDNMVKLVAEQESMTKEAMRRNPSVSDLQFLEDERESLRLALDEMEIENQKLAAELLRYKQAVHRQLHSSSTSADSPQDVGIVLRVPRSGESVFADDNSNSRSYESSDERQQVERMMRPLSLVSPSLSRSQLSLPRTLSDVGMPLSPDCKNHSVGLQISPTAKVNTSFGSRSSSASYSRTRVCQICRKSEWSKHIDIAVGTNSHRPTSLFLNEMRSIGVSTDVDLHVAGSHSDMSEVGESPTVGKLRTKEKIVQTISTFSSTVKPIAETTDASETVSLPKASPRPHSLLFEEMRKQLAHVRTIAESMDNVVNVEAIDADMELRGKAMLDAKSKSNCGTIQKQQMSRLAKSLQKYIRDMEISVTEDSDKSDIHAHSHSNEIQKWNLHGHTDANAMADRIAMDDSLTLNERSLSDEFDLYSMSTVRSFQLGQRAADHVGNKILEATVLVIIMYILITSLPWSAKFKIFSLLLLFFVF